MDKDKDDKDNTKSNWLEVKRHRNRVNSRKTRNRERDQLGILTHRKTCLYLTNTALQYQNKQMREAIRLIREQLNRVASSAPAPVPPNPSIGTGPGFFPHQSIPTNPTILPPPQHTPMQQPQQMIQQMLTHTASLPRPQAPAQPAVGNMNPVISIIQTELARNPMLSAAMSAGILQLMPPNNNLMHMNSTQQQLPPQQTTIPMVHQQVAVPLLQQALNAELARSNHSMVALQQPMIIGQHQESNVSGNSTTSTTRSNNDEARDATGDEEKGTAV